MKSSTRLSLPKSRLTSQRVRLLAYVSLALALLFVLLASRPTLIFSAPSAQTLITEVWQRAHEVGMYDYHTDIVQTTWRTPKLENAGLSSQQERIYIEGRTNLNEDFMQIKLYSEASEQNALEIQVENGQSLGRNHQPTNPVP